MCRKQKTDTINKEKVTKLKLGDFNTLLSEIDRPIR